jgi:uncharacterized protein (UPF0371 family)
MIITVEPSIAIKCFDVKVNGVLVERFDKKYQANAFKEQLEKLSSTRQGVYYNNH